MMMTVSVMIVKKAWSVISNNTHNDKHSCNSRVDGHDDHNDNMANIMICFPDWYVASLPGHQACSRILSGFVPVTVSPSGRRGTGHWPVMGDLRLLRSFSFHHNTTALCCLQIVWWCWHLGGEEYSCWLVTDLPSCQLHHHHHLWTYNHA